MGAEMDLRSRLLRLVESYPGLHLRALQRRAGCSTMLAEYHLNVLERLGLVTSTTHGRYRDFFPVRNTPMPLDAGDKRWLGILRRPPILAITLLLLERGPMRPAHIADEMGLANSTAAYQVATMTKAGLAVQDVQGGRNMVRLADADRALEILRAHHPTPDLLSDYAELWSNVFKRPARTPADEAGDDVPEAVRDLPLAVQAVYLALQDGPSTQKEICLATGHARRTVYAALRRLADRGLVASRPHLLDTRQTHYWLTDAGEP